MLDGRKPCPMRHNDPMTNLSVFVSVFLFVLVVKKSRVIRWRHSDCESDGVWCYDGKAIKNFTENDGLINNAVMNVLEDSAGNLWFGTKWFGLSRYDGKTFMTFSQYEN